MWQVNSYHRVHGRSGIFGLGVRHCRSAFIVLLNAHAQILSHSTGLRRREHEVREVECRSLGSKSDDDNYVDLEAILSLFGEIEMPPIRITASLRSTAFTTAQCVAVILRSTEVSSRLLVIVVRSNLPTSLKKIVTVYSVLRRVCLLLLLRTRSYHYCFDAVAE